MLFPFELGLEDESKTLQFQPYWDWFEQKTKLEVLCISSNHEDELDEESFHLSKEKAKELIQILQDFVDGYYDDKKDPFSSLVNNE